MKLIVGLGNKGEEYEKTRHNLGFEFIDFFVKKIKATFSEKNKLAIWGLKTVKGKKIIFAKPMTFMNLSGDAVLSFVKKHKIKPEDILVVHDDIDLPLFKIKIKKGGGAAGHKGIISIIERLNTGDFIRVRIGVGKPKYKNKVADYVLEKFSNEEQEQYLKKFEIISQFVMNFILEGYDKAVSKFKDL